MFSNFEKVLSNSRKEQNYKESQEDKEEECKSLPKKFRNYLKEQISLPKEKRDKKFKEYADRVYTKSQPHKQEKEITPEQEREATFKRYLKSLLLAQNNLKDKRLLDLGCGEGEFVEICLEKGLTSEVYGQDVFPFNEKDEEKYKEHFIKKNFYKSIPLNDFDYIFALGSIRVPHSKKLEKDFKKLLTDLMDSLKDRGEVRIFPIEKPGKEDNMEWLKETQEKWFNFLDELSSKGVLTYNLEPVNIAASGNSKDEKDVWLQQVLIIKKPEGGE